MTPEHSSSESINNHISNGGSRSLTWLATSTLAYLAGYSGDTHPPNSKTPNTTTTQLRNDNRMDTEKVRETTWEKQGKNGKGGGEGGKPGNQDADIGDETSV